MWLYLFFDLPTDTIKQQRAYRKFHEFLLKDGFMMFQYSVYIRHAVSIEIRDQHIKKIEKVLPEEGKISILTITDKQFELMKNYWGAEYQKPPEKPQQLELF